MIRRFQTIVLALMASPMAEAQQPAPDFNIVGKWTWVLINKDIAPGCEETWEFRADGVMTSLSGQEVLEKRYTIDPAAPGEAWLETTVTATNRKPDCIGKTTEGIDTKVHMFMRRQQDGRVLTCMFTTPGTCIGEMRPMVR